MKIVIVDYGMGNIRSISSTLCYLGVEEVILSSDYETLNSADKIVLPGVGSFAKAMSHVRQKKLDTILEEIVMVKRKPLLGICLGMQLMGLSSTEDGNTKGLSFVRGEVTRFNDSTVKVPHVGFNQVKTIAGSRLFSGLPESPDFYFTHSYRMTGSGNMGQSICDYDGDFIAAFESENVAGVQFHPELSQQNGLILLKNFIKLF